MHTGYRGQRLEGVKHGHGEYVYEECGRLFRFEGEWFNNEKHGFGKFWIGDDSVYEGQFQHGEMEGEGTRTWKNGSQYTGEFSQGMMHGYGVFTSPKETYEGDHVFNTREGDGKLSRADGLAFEGQFKDHQPNGEGALTLPNGDSYRGPVVQCKPHGSGHLQQANGDTFAGQFVNGAKHGRFDSFEADTRVQYSGFFLLGSRILTFSDLLPQWDAPPNDPSRPTSRASTKTTTASGAPPAGPVFWDFPQGALIDHPPAMGSASSPIGPPYVEFNSALPGINVSTKQTFSNFSEFLSGQPFETTKKRFLEMYGTCDCSFDAWFDAIQSEDIPKCESLFEEQIKSSSESNREISISIVKIGSSAITKIQELVASAQQAQVQAAAAAAAAMPKGAKPEKDKTLPPITFSMLSLPEISSCCEQASFVRPSDLPAPSPPSPSDPTVPPPPQPDWSLIPELSEHKYILPYPDALKIPSGDLIVHPKHGTGEFILMASSKGLPSAYLAFSVIRIPKDAPPAPKKK